MNVDFNYKLTVFLSPPHSICNVLCRICLADLHNHLFDFAFRLLFSTVGIDVSCDCSHFLTPCLCVSHL